MKTDQTYDLVYAAYLDLHQLPATETTNRARFSLEQALAHLSGQDALSVVIVD